jgi:hypothetical protein
MLTKHCSVCALLTTNFGPDKRASDKLQSCCRACNNERQNKRPRAKKDPKKAAIVDKKWRIKNPDKKNFHLAKRRAAKLQRTPPWLTAEQTLQIQEFYSDAAELQWLSEDKLEVDHIIPLQGKEVSGLHVPWNLQIVPSKLNSSKGNRCYPKN